MTSTKIENFIFFDGVKTNKECFAKNEYWLGSNEAEKYLDAYILFPSFNSTEVKINLFKQTKNTLIKNLTEFEAPKNGFYKSDLLDLSQQFQFGIRKVANGMNEGFSLGYSLSVAIFIITSKMYFLIFSINGTRAPESIYFFGLFDVHVDDEFKTKYISDLQ